MLIEHRGTAGKRKSKAAQESDDVWAKKRPALRPVFLDCWERELLRLFLRIALLAGLAVLGSLFAALMGAGLASGLGLIAAAFVGEADAGQKCEGGNNGNE